MDVESRNIFKCEAAGLDGAAMSVIRIEPACVVRSGIKISVNGGPYVRSQPWNGQIDEVAIWLGRNDLTISEVRQLYNNGAGLPFSSFH
jgi:hypothetical protein